MPTSVPGAGVIVGTTEKDGKKYKILEFPIDPPMTVKRQLVPIDTEENETPEGSRLLDENESAGILSRSAAPEKLRRGDPVRLASEPTKLGNVTAILKSGLVSVQWQGGLLDRLDPKLLQRLH